MTRRNMVVVFFVLSVVPVIRQRERVSCSKHPRRWASNWQRNFLCWLTSMRDSCLCPVIIPNSPTPPPPHAHARARACMHAQAHTLGQPPLRFCPGRGSKKGHAVVLYNLSISACANWITRLDVPDELQVLGYQWVQIGQSQARFRRISKPLTDPKLSGR